MVWAVLHPVPYSCLGGLRKIVGDLWLWWPREVKASVRQMEAGGRWLLEIHRQHKDGKNWEQTIFSPFTAPCPRISTAEPPVFPTPLGPGGLGGLDRYLGVWLGVNCSRACRGNWIGEAPYKTGRPCSECPPSYGGGCQNNLCYKGTWWREKAGTNLCLETFN